MLAGFAVKIVVDVFGFSETVQESEVVEKQAVHAERMMALGGLRVQPNCLPLT